MKLLHCFEGGAWLLAGLHYHDVSSVPFVGFVVVGWIAASIRETSK